MVKKSKGPKKDKRSARRQERRFVSQSATNPRVVYSLPWLSALLLGAGAWA
jgi:hypothetical protein